MEGLLCTLLVAGVCYLGVKFCEFLYDLGAGDYD